MTGSIGLKISFHLARKISTGLWGGEGFVFQKIEGNGIVFINSGGTVLNKSLDNQKIQIDTNSLVAFEENLNFDIQKSGNLKFIAFGGEGVFLSSLEGKGQLWMQSFHSKKFKKV